MKKYIPYEKKLADWESAFDSMNSSQGKEAKVLAGLIQGLKDNMMARNANQIPGATA